MIIISMNKFDKLERLRKYSVGGAVYPTIGQSAIDPITGQIDPTRLAQIQTAQQNAINTFQKPVTYNAYENDPFAVEVTGTGLGDTTNTTVISTNGAMTTVNTDGTRTSNTANATTSNVNSNVIPNSVSKQGNVPYEAIGDMATATLGVIDQATMGDKNFGTQSAAIDAGVHQFSKAASKFGPWGLLAAGIAESANFITKAGGQTVQGFDVNINNSGYGQLAHMDSSSHRDFGAAIGLGGLNTRKMERLLAKRNEAASMALNAANISDTIKYEQEARMNSVEDVIRKNQIALSGGIDTAALVN